MPFDTNSIDDFVELKLGSDVVQIYEDYDIAASILQQPAAFSARLGWTKTARELLRKYPPRTEYELRMRRVNEDPSQGVITVQSGRLDGVSVSGSDSGTSVTFKGRDHLAPLFDAFVPAERSFAEKTYVALTKAALRAVGLEERAEDLEVSNEANRKAITGIKKLVQTFPPRNTEDIQVDAVAGTKKIVYNTIKAELGERWIQFLERQYKLAGLFLWAGPAGGFVLSEPNANQEPAYQIVRQRGGLRNSVNVLDVQFNNSHVNRHSSAIVYGRSGGGKSGRKKIRGEFVDEGLTSLGYVKPIVLHDEDARTPKECEYVARRHIAEECRSGWTLQYTVAGHRTPALKGKSFAIWSPDTVVDVRDEELGIEGLFYIESVNWRRGPQTTTVLTLMRIQDLVFAEKQPGIRERDRKAKKKTKPRDA